MDTMGSCVPRLSPNEFPNPSLGQRKGFGKGGGGACPVPRRPSGHYKGPHVLVMSQMITETHIRGN